MERSENTSKILTILFLVIVIIQPIQIQAQRMKTQSYNLFISGNTAKWKTIIDNHKFSEISGHEHIDFLYLHYGYIAYCIGIEKTSLAEKYLDKAFAQLDKMQKKYPNKTELWALKAAFYGFRIGISPYKAVYYGPKSVEAAEKALTLDPNCAVAQMEMGNIEFYKPAIFGGKKSNAVSYYQKATEQFELHQKTANNWLYINSLTSLARNYEAIGNYPSAIAVYQKILLIEPKYDWVKNTLLPAAQKKAL